MVTYEDVTEMFLSAAEATGLSVHPELWLNTQTLEREFACTLHPGPCEEAERRAACTISFAWGPLDTVLSIDGAEGVCDFFHEPDEDCPHLHTENVPPLVLDLTYNLPLEHARFSDGALRQLARSLKLRASEHSSRAVETRPNIALALGENGMEAEALTLQQRVELPLWDPDGVSGFRASGEHRSGHMTLGGRGRRSAGNASYNDDADDQNDDPHPEDWLPHLLTEVADDITHVLEALESSRTVGGANGQDSGQNN
ncbi:MAG: hypothetical protein ABI068_09995 [Ktedonobacterales bacterium]